MLAFCFIMLYNTLVLEHMNISSKLDKLQSAFPRLSEANQQYMLGVAEGLKFAQEKNLESQAVYTADVKQKDEHE